MDNVKFVEEFNKITKNEFDGIIKFSSATYYQKRKELIVTFISEYEKFHTLTNEDEVKIDNALKEIFPAKIGYNFEVKKEIKSTHADQTSVLNTVAGYFNQKNKLIYKSIDKDNVDIEIDDWEIKVVLNLETPLYSMLLIGKPEDLTVGLQNYLDKSFMQSIIVVANEKEMTKEEAEKLATMKINTEGILPTQMRVIKLDIKNKIYSIFKRPKDIPSGASYLVDMKKPAENVMICGKVSNFSMKPYNYSKYDPNDPSTFPQERFRLNFYLDDTTGKMPCVCFLKSRADVDKFNLISDGYEVAVFGNISEFNGSINCTVSAVYECGINYNSIVLENVKPTPLNYRNIEPEKYTEIKRIAAIGDEELPDTNSDYFKDNVLVIYDLEATDKKIDTAEIVEIAALKVVDGVPIETFKTLINPKMHIPDEVTEKVHHISDDMVADMPTMEDVIDDFYKFTRGAKLVGHNILGYDYPLMNKYMVKAHYKFDNDMEDTLTMARKYLANDIEDKNFRLESLSKHYHIEHENAHRAMADVLATYEILKIIAKKMQK